MQSGYNGLRVNMPFDAEKDPLVYTRKRERLSVPSSDKSLDHSADPCTINKSDTLKKNMKDL